VKGGNTNHSKIRRMAAMLKGKATTLKGSREVLAIGGTRMVSRRKKRSVEEE
jgi:hypothetical protein